MPISPFETFSFSYLAAYNRVVILRPAHRGTFELSEQDNAVVQAILAKIDEARQNNDRISTITLAGLCKLLTSEEMAIIHRVVAIDPAHYGVRRPYLGFAAVPKDLVRVEKQPYYCNGTRHYTEVQYLPEGAYAAYRAMADALERDLNRRLLIESSYRSNAYQAVTFLWILELVGYDVPRALRRAATPGYSEHSTPASLALDLQNIDGKPTDENPIDFEDTSEYTWLLAHAHKYGFLMSYPKANPHGLMFEPWHWRHLSGQ